MVEDMARHDPFNRSKLTRRHMKAIEPKDPKTYGDVRCLHTPGSACSRLRRTQPQNQSVKVAHRDGLAVSSPQHVEQGNRLATPLAEAEAEMRGHDAKHAERTASKKYAPSTITAANARA